MATVMTVEEYMERTRSGLGKKTIYGWGQGPSSLSFPFPEGIECDCSGFVCWCLGIPRRTNHPEYHWNGGWLNTDAIFRDIHTTTGFFRRINLPRVGAVVVYPRKTSATAGHIGVISYGYPNKDYRVIHCSAGNSRQGDAIQETSPAVFQKHNAIFGWYSGIVAAHLPTNEDYKDIPK